MTDDNWVLNIRSHLCHPSLPPHIIKVVLCSPKLVYWALMRKLQTQHEVKWLWRKFIAAFIKQFFFFKLSDTLQWIINWPNKGDGNHNAREGGEGEKSLLFLVKNMWMTIEMWHFSPKRLVTLQGLLLIESHSNLTLYLDVVTQHLW